MTFCTPVSISSPKLWALSFYHGTLTKDSFLANKNDSVCNNNNNNEQKKQNDNSGGDNSDDDSSTGILQLLTFDHRHLVPILGKKSGRDIDKSVACSEEGFPWWKTSNTNTAATATTSIEEPAAVDANENEKEEDDCCRKRSANHGNNSDFEVLPGCALYLQVECCRSSKSLIDAGDHVVAICKVTRTGVWQPEHDNDGGDDRIGGKIQWLDEVHDDSAISLPLGAMDESNALYSGRLRQEGII